jgi:hypothetical protein
VAAAQTFRCICFAAACAIFVGKVRWWLCWPYQHPILRCQRQLLESQPQGLPRRMLQKNAFPAACCRDSNSSRQEFLDVYRRRYCRDRVLSHCCACWQNTRYSVHVFETTHLSGGGGSKVVAGGGVSSSSGGSSSSSSSSSGSSRSNSAYSTPPPRSLPGTTICGLNNTQHRIVGLNPTHCAGGGKQRRAHQRVPSAAAVSSGSCGGSSALLRWRQQSVPSAAVVGAAAMRWSEVSLPCRGRSGHPRLRDALQPSHLHKSLVSFVYIT